MASKDTRSGTRSYYTVPTKSYDGDGSPKHIVGGGQGNADDSKRRRGNHSRPIQQGNQRKTRLTWELHPSLLLHDVILALEAEDHEHSVSDEEEDEQEHAMTGKKN